MIPQKNVKANDCRELPALVEPERLRALVVDDELVMVHLVGNMFESLGFRVDQAYGGAEALTLLERNGYDLVLTDLMMPGMNGFELAERVRQRSKDTRIIIMTGCSPAEVQDKMQTGLVDRWLFKPFIFVQLIEMVGELFGADSWRGKRSFLVTVRSLQPEDNDVVRQINIAAFNRSTEANIVEDVRAECAEALSLVAVNEGRVVGYILFSPVRATAGRRTVTGMGLAPMAVQPQCQQRGIGSLLVRAGIDLLRERGYPFLVVLGRPGYYARFGFEPAVRHGLSCQWEAVSAEAFRVLVLNRDEMKKVSGLVSYLGEFADMM